MTLNKGIVLMVLNVALSIAGYFVSAAKDANDYEQMKREIIEELAKK